MDPLGESPPQVFVRPKTLPLFLGEPVARFWLEGLRGGSPLFYKLIPLKIPDGGAFIL